MKVDIERKAESNVAASVDFSFSENASKLFAMLSSHLYSNKELAVIHELCANAHDAHKLVGKGDQPFTLVFPTTLDSHLRIRDYGPGLSEDNVYRLLTKYGESDKQNSNDMIGGWGIGSKSPAAVTDTWTIISHNEGHLKEYLVFINGQGVPSLTKIRTEPTTETGLEVIVPVNPNRISYWNPVVRRAFRHYDVPPIVKNISLEAYKPVKVFSGDGWFVHNKDNDIMFITSQREYMVDKEKLTQEIKDEKLVTLLRRVGGLVIRFDIGELELSISREQVQYTKHTIEAIKARLEIIDAELYGQFVKANPTTVDGLQFRTVLAKFVADSGKDMGYYGANRGTLFNSYLKRLGNPHNVNNVEDDLKTFKVDLKLDKMKKYKLKAFHGNVMSDPMLKSFTCWKTYAIRYEPNIEKLTIKIPYLDRIIIVHADVYDAPSRIRYNCKGQNKFILMMEDVKWLPAELKKYVVKASTYDRPPKQARVAQAKVDSELWAIKGRMWARVKESDLVSNNYTKYVYVHMTNGTTVDSVMCQEPGVCSGWDRYNLVKQFGYEIIGIKPGKAVPKWLKSVDETIEADYARLSKSPVVEQQMYSVAVSELRTSYAAALQLLKKHYTLRTPNASVWNEAAEQVEKIMKLSSTDNSYDYRYFRELERALKVTVKKEEAISFDKVKQTLYDTYTMLQYVDPDRIPKVEFEKYIMMVGK